MQTLSLILAAAFICLSPNTLAAGPLLTDFLDLRTIRAAVPASTAEVFAGAVGASPEQRQAAASLVETARTEVGRAVNRHLRAVRDEAPSLAALEASERAVIKTVSDVERRLLDDLRSLLTPAQVEAFARFERAHRRELLAVFGERLPLSIDLVRFLQTEGLDADASPDLRALAARFDEAGDRLLIDHVRALNAARDAGRETFDGSPEARARLARLREDEARTEAALARFQFDTLQAALGLLPPDKAARLLTAALARRLGAYAVAIDPARAPIAREFEAFDLPPPQRRSAEALIESARREILEAARRAIANEASLWAADPDARQRLRSANQEPIPRLAAAAARVQRTLRTDLLALLTPEERERYDALPVLDKPASSPIIDEDPPP